ncbi:hypothetical protein BGW80DRAFT_1294552 [Lactifluus volemus]|nr:hypothetical protein BGW80DRAFT_1294552 [Lactifluus volemus]
MVIDWEVVDCQPVDTAAAIERALLLNDAAIQTPPRQRVKTSSPSSPHRVPAVAEIDHQVTLRSGDRPAPAGQSVRTSAGSLNTQATMACSQGSPARDTTSDHSRLSIHRKTISNVSIFPPSRTWTTSSNPQAPSTSSESQPLPLPSPSQRATLRHILQLRQRASPFIITLVHPAKLCPSPKLPQTENPSRQSTESAADVVAAAINQSTRLDRAGPSNMPVPSTPLRLYQKRLSQSPAVRGIERSTTPPSEARQQARRSSSSRRYSIPPIAVLTSASVASSSENLKADLASSSTCGEEYDELELSYPSSPMQPPQEALLEPHPPAIVPTKSQAFMEPAAEPASQSPLLGTEPPSSGKHAVMRSAALRYLERYFQTFDMDPHALAEAYAPDAVFSCSSRMCAQGRDAVDFGALCSGDKVEYDVTYLGPGIGVLLVVLGTFSGARDRNGSAGVSWPMVASVHQMMLR